LSRIFISHSSRNNAQAVALADWLAANGWGRDDIFLDFAGGIAPGERWQKALNDAAGRCEAVVFLISRDWLASRWCHEELALAHKLNKRLFGVLIDTVDVMDVPARLREEWQLIDLESGRDGVRFDVALPKGQQGHATFSAAGLDQLRAGLVKAGLDPRWFVWPPPGEPGRAPYRGLAPMEEEDAGIFYGREAATIAALDQLRGLAEAAPPRLMAVLGASGAGKSSFMRAGLIPRLKRDDRNFLVLPVVRPERAAMSGKSGLVASLQATGEALGLKWTKARIAREVAGADTDVAAFFLRLLAALRTTGTDKTLLPAVVLPIDQAEELFLAEGREEAQAFLALLAKLLKLEQPRLIALVTIRTDSYEKLQQAPQLNDIRQSPFNLPALARGAYQRVIEGPAERLAGTPRALKIEPALTAALLADIEQGGAKDALPLLAFTLERLHADHGSDGDLTLAEYEESGRIAGAIDAAVKRAFASADGDPAVPKDNGARLALLRRAMIPWLAGIDPETKSPRRQVARFTDIPDEARPLIQHFVEQRLLATDVSRETGERTIEPAHEALLRQWGLIDSWLKEDIAALAALEGVRRAARDWDANRRHENWLSHSGGRLDDAEAVKSRTDLVRRLDATDLAYLDAARAEEMARRDRELDEAKKLAAARKLAARRTTIGAVAAVMLAIVAGVFGWIGFKQAGIAAEQALIARNQADEAKRQKELADRAAADAEIQRAKAEAAAKEAVAQRAEAESQRAKAEVAAREADSERAEAETQKAAAETAAAEASRQKAAADEQAAEAARQKTIADERAAEAQRQKELAVKAAAEAERERGVAEAAAKEAQAQRAEAEKQRAAAEAAAAEAAQQRTVAEEQAAEAQRQKELAEQAAADAERERAKAVAAAAEADRQRAEAERQKAAAEAAAAEAKKNETVSLAALSRVAQSEGHPIAAIKLALAAWPRKGDEQRLPLRNTVESLVLAFRDFRESLLLGKHEGPVLSAVFSADGRRIVTASWDNTARVWNADTGARVALMQGHEGKVNSAAFSRDGTRIVTASDDNTARVWDATTGTQLALLQGHTDTVESAAFSPDDTRIITASRDNTARVWDAASGTQLALMTGHEDRVLSAAFSPDGTRVVTASFDNTARVWDAATGDQLALLKGHGSFVNSAAFSPDGTRVITASLDNTARVWDAATGAQIALMKAHEDQVNSAAFSPDGTRAVTASSDNTARVWDAASGAQLALMRGHEDRINSAAFSPDGARIVTASNDNTARMWDAASGVQIALLKGHELPVNSAAFSPDGTRVVTASFDHSARVWDATSGAQIVPLTGHEKSVNSAAFSLDGTRIATASWDKTARVWDAVTGAQLALMKGHEDVVTSVAFSPDGTRVVTASWDNTARMWDAVTGAQLALMKGHEGYVNSATFSPDGTRIVTASFDNTARVWDAASGAQLALMKGHEDVVDSAAFSPDGTYVVTASQDGTARVWDAVTGAQLALMKGHEGYVNSAAFSPDGTRIVTASWDKTARVWDAVTGAQLALMKGHEDVVTSVAFSPEGTRIVTGSFDNTARVWDAASGAQVAVLKGHKSPVNPAAFSPDGTRVVTASGPVMNLGVEADFPDNTARVWDAASGAQLALLMGHQYPVTSAAFSPDGTHVVTASDDKTARIWNITLPKGDAFQIACTWLANDTDFSDVEARYGLTNLPPICGDHTPLPVDPAKLQ
jgi:WD40 repeat protein